MLKLVLKLYMQAGVMWSLAKCRPMAHCRPPPLTRYNQFHGSFVIYSDKIYFSRCDTQYVPQNGFILHSYNSYKRVSCFQGFQSCEAPEFYESWIPGFPDSWVPVDSNQTTTTYSDMFPKSLYPVRELISSGIYVSSL